MVVREFPVSKKIDVRGTKVTRNATVKLNWAGANALDQSGKRVKILEFAEPAAAVNDCIAACGGSELLMVQFCDLGRMYYARSVANNALGGADRKLNALIKEFKTQVSAVIEYNSEDENKNPVTLTDEQKEKIRQRILAKETFGPVREYYARMESDGAEAVFDYTEEFPVPQLFQGGDEADETEDDDDEEDV